MKSERGAAVAVESSWPTRTARARADWRRRGGRQRGEGGEHRRRAWRKYGAQFLKLTGMLVGVGEGMAERIVAILKQLQF